MGGGGRRKGEKTVGAGSRGYKQAAGEKRVEGQRARGLSLLSPL